MDILSVTLSQFPTVLYNTIELSVSICQFIMTVAFVVVRGFAILISNCAYELNPKENDLLNSIHDSHVERVLVVELPET